MLSLHSARSVRFQCLCVVLVITGMLFSSARSVRRVSASPLAPPPSGPAPTVTITEHGMLTATNQSMFGPGAATPPAEPEQHAAQPLLESGAGVRGQ